MALAKKKYEMRKGYVAIDAGRLSMDARAQFAKGVCDTDEIYINKFLESFGLCASTFTNAYHNYERPIRKDVKNPGVSNNEVVDHLYYVEDPQINRIGIMQNVYYLTVIRIFKLEDIYRLTLRSEISKKKPEENSEVSSNDIVQNSITKQDIDELRTDLRMLTKSIVLLSETLSANLKQKPSAVLPKKEVLIK